MNQISNPVQVSVQFFNLACGHLERAGRIRAVRAGDWGLDIHCAATNTLVGADGVLCKVDSVFFDSVVVQGTRSRAVNGTEYEMLCRKLEAHRRGDKKAEAELSLPAWTSELYEKAVADGRASLRGVGALVSVPFEISLLQACVSSQEQTAVHRPRQMG